MATTPIYGKNPIKIFLEQGQWPLDLISSTGDEGPTTFVKKIILGDPDQFNVKVKFAS